MSELTVGKQLAEPDGDDVSDARAIKRTVIHLVRIVLVAAMAIVLVQPTGAQDLRLPEPVGMNGDPAAALVLAGNVAFAHGDLNVATRDYRAALARIPDFAVARFNLGLVEIHLGSRSRGLADMDRGLTLARSHHMSVSDLSRLRSLRAAFAQAADDKASVVT